MLLSAAKCEDYNFYRFRVIKRKPTGGGERENYFPPSTTPPNCKKSPQTHPQIRAKNNHGILIYLKCKHVNDYVKEMKTNHSDKIHHYKSEKQDPFEVKEALENVIKYVAKVKTEVAEVVDEKENNRKGMADVML